MAGSFVFHVRISGMFDEQDQLPPAPETVIRLNYYHQREVYLLSNPPALTGGSQFGVVSYFCAVRRRGFAGSCAQSARRQRGDSSAKTSVVRIRYHAHGSTRILDPEAELKHARVNSLVSRDLRTWSASWKACVERCVYGVGESSPIG